MKSLSKKDIKDINEQVGIVAFSKKELVQEEDDKYYVNKELLFFKREGKFVPTIRFLLKNLFLPKVVVDMGAVKFVVNGADVMRPGIVRVDPDLQVGSLVVIVDVNNGKPLAVGELVLSSLEIMAASSGKVIKNIHWVGDELWKGREEKTA